MHPEQGKNPKLIVKGRCFSYSRGFRSGNTVGFPAWDSSYFSDVQDVGPLFWADFTPDKEGGILGAVEDQWVGRLSTVGFFSVCRQQHNMVADSMGSGSALEFQLCYISGGSYGTGTNLYVLHVRSQHRYGFKLLQLWLFIEERCRAYQGPANQKDLILHHHRVQKWQYSVMAL